MAAYGTVDELREYLSQVPKYSVQRVTISGNPTGGTFTLTYENVATGVISYNSTATALKTLLEAVSGIGSGNAKVAGPAGGPWDIVFSGNAGIAPLLLGTNSLTGGTSPTATPTLAADTLMQAALDRSTRIIERYLDMSFAAYGSTAAKVVTGWGTSFLMLPSHLLGSITTVVTESGVTILAADYTEQEDGSLYLDNSYGFPMPYNLLSPGWGYGRYTVTAKWGVGPVPDDVKEVCLELAKNIYHEKEAPNVTDVIGVSGDGGIAVGYQGALTKRQKMILDLVKDELTVGEVVV